MQTMRLQAFKPACVGRQPRLVVVNSAIAPPATIPYKAADGSEKGNQQLALKVAEESAKGLVHRYLVLVQQNARQGTASTKTRSEVRGGGKKPYAQKGTGNARRGSSVSPLFPGGGVTFGPKPKDWKISMNKKEKRLALATALQSAAADMIVVESLDGKLKETKTKEMVALLEKLGADVMSRKVLLITKDARPDLHLAGRNIAKLTFNTASSLNVLDILHADHIIVEDEALAHIQATLGGSAKASDE
ncbi:plastid/chloroplast ribosomal protein L4 [Volvox carteri f. nagariensis]|uniref:Large ribosomal subunit protein uL4c n=1 Tax=Volvox carteri f. nagariensis TaxID=3068 RepID=D8UEM8_VOLCA|nr:plastid/chloroplast ribosomal protein L4 [Volvox carteri f. nagariensis]EFJ41763.1 plastid/chloroplast ribosomal protein L4 [Volvox carteri f. nagariensis]|eukprot:XP_002957109.1 plastid/chloroplast ribosomal protein L4 [Volvox carteri f. nagariensis]